MTVALSEPWQAGRVERALALSPFAVALSIKLAAPTYFAPMLAPSPEILGVPMGAVLGGATLLWAALGAWMVWTTRSPLVAGAALTLCTAPSTVLLSLGPALILILQNLT